MIIAHRLVGYDRKTQRVADEHNVPIDLLPKAKIIARVPDDDPDVAMCYALSKRQTHNLARLLETNINPIYKYFLEGFA